MSEVRPVVDAHHACLRVRRKLARLSRRSLAAAMLLGAVSGSALAADRVSIRLEGDIVPECAIGASSATLDLGDISKPGSRDFSFTLNCNAPFEYRLEAQHGALTHEAAGTLPPGFLGAQPYAVAVDIPTTGAPISDRCAGETLQTGHVHCLFSNSQTAIAREAQGRLTLSWAAGRGELPAGAYAERLTIAVGIQH